MQAYDAVIVLANLMDADGNLNPDTISRLSAACDLWSSGRAPVILTCGWAYRDDSEVCIADAMKRHAILHMGVPAEAILTETASRDTVGDAVLLETQPREATRLANRCRGHKRLSCRTTCQFLLNLRSSHAR